MHSWTRAANLCRGLSRAAAGGGVGCSGRCRSGSGSGGGISVGLVAHTGKHASVDGLLLLFGSAHLPGKQGELGLDSRVGRSQSRGAVQVLLRSIEITKVEVRLTTTEERLGVVGIGLQNQLAVFNHLGPLVSFVIVFRMTAIVIVIDS